MKSKVKIHFLGASGTVTGSKYLVEFGEKKILIDCGLFQGLKKLRELNWTYLPVDVNDIDAVLLTHGHLDHVGFLPRLVKMGYKKSIYGTEPSLEIARTILMDSGKIQEEEAKRANEDGYSKHHPAVALYNLEEAIQVFDYMQSLPEGEWIPLFEGIEIRFQYVSHIIGACYIEINFDGKRYVFSGDVGRKSDPLLFPPKKPENADVLLIETTYGDRLHPDENVMENLVEVIKMTAANGGSLLIPSFAVERTQNLMFMLAKLKDKKIIPDIPMIMDSPMGDRVLSIFKNYKDWYNSDIADFDSIMSHFKIVKHYKQTWETIENKESKIVIAGSGMVTGGRILTYLEHYLDQPEHTVLLVGYQGEGTRGRAMKDGVHEIKFRGKFVDVKARIHCIESLSSHADQAELLDWISEIKNTPEHVFLVHGEEQARDAFRVKLKDARGWNPQLPELFQIVEL